MARRKREKSSGGNAPWLNTFADLMNLLLCFFVMLFAMSDVNGRKFEDIAISFTNAFSVFDSGGSAIGEGILVSSGMSQLNNLDEYFSNMGEKTQETGDTIDDDTSKEGKQNTIGNQGDIGGNQGDTTGNQGDTTGNQGDTSGDVGLEEARQKILEAMAAGSEAMYDQVSDLSDQYNLGDYVELSIDPEFEYVQLSLKGSILFESGKADIITEARPILSRLGDLLGKFEGYIVEIIGHTDNVPMYSDAFKDNNWLSSARALNAAEFLIENNKLDASMVKYSGRGEYEPVATNDTAEGRAKNRRIEIRIYNALSN